MKCIYNRTYNITMASIKTEVTMSENGDDDQWLYGDSNSNLDPVVALPDDIKPAEPVGILEDEVLFNV